MHATEIIVREVQSASGFQVRQLLRESVRQARESPHLHPYGQVLPLDVRRANVLRIRVTSSHLGYNLHDWAWGVPLVPMLPIIAKQFLELRVVSIAAERSFNGLGIENIGIGR